MKPTPHKLAPEEASKLVSEAELRLHILANREMFNETFTVEEYFKVMIPLAAFVGCLMDCKMKQRRKDDLRKRFDFLRCLMGNEGELAVMREYTPRHKEALLYILKEWDAFKSRISKVRVMEKALNTHSSFDAGLDDLPPPVPK